MSNGSDKVRSIGIIILATLAVIGALYFGREFLVPIALAFLFNALLRPLTRRLEATHVPAPAGAAIVVIGVVGVIGAGGLVLAGPVQDWAAKAPETLASAQAKLAKLRRPLQQITSAAAKLEQATGGSETSPAGSRSPPAQPASPQLTQMATRIFGTTTAIIGGAVEVLLLLYLLLAAGDLFLEKLVKVLPFFGEKRTAVEVVHEVESVVSRYVVTTAFINLGQALVVALALWLLKMPNPALWGVLTFFAEFVPYLGAALMIGLLFLAALATFDSLGPILLAPGSYLLITTLQNNLVSPLAYGYRLRLNPVAVLIGVIFWWFLWGVPGAFLAVPIIAAVKILADHVERLTAVAEFLGE